MATPPTLPSAIPYDQWLVEAFREVVRRTLDHAARQGLAGNHHFYITFATDATGVVLHDQIRAQHPHEMTIVIQNQFRNLVVEPEAFSVALRFTGVERTLRVPFAAITAFLDPGVNFGLQLKLGAEAKAEPEKPAPTAKTAEPTEPTEPTEPKATAAKVVSLETFRRK